jgi:hypothetical protein
MRFSKSIISVLILVITLTGCGLGTGSTEESTRLMESGCKAYQKDMKNDAYVEDFSNLAAIDPTYLELSKAAGILYILSISMNSNSADSVKLAYAESAGTLFGFCRKYR